MFTPIYYNGFGSQLTPHHWAIYQGVPACCPDARWDKGQVVVKDGMLTVKNTRQPDGSYLSGGLSQAPHLNQTYGRWRVRFRFDPGKGVKMCLMLWQTGTPIDKADHAYEIDFAEGYVADRSQMSSTLHYPPGNQEVHHFLYGDFSKWHTMGVTWKPNELEYTIDGKVWAETVGPEVPSVPMHLAIQTTTGSPDPVDSTTPNEVDLQIDHIKIWSYSP